MTKIGVLTSGGDSPGMNAAVMAVAKSASYYGMSLVGIKRGYNGLLGIIDDECKNCKDKQNKCKDCKKQLCDGNRELRVDVEEMHPDTILDIADLPGTYLRTARCDEFLCAKWREVAANNLKAMGIEGLVVIGGDGSFQGAKYLCELGIPCIGIPATIDNDLAYTEMTLGFDTAVNVCVDAVRSIRATSRSHDRPAVVEVMGRHCGDIALMTAVSTGSEIVVVPEVKWKVERVADLLNRQLEKGNTRATIILAEGCYEKNSMEPFDVYNYLAPRGKECFKGEPMSANRFASVMKRMCGMVEARATVLGYTQRGAEPTARDSAFAFEAGHMAVKLLHDGLSNQVIGMKNGKVMYMPIMEALACKRTFNTDLFKQVNQLEYEEEMLKSKEEILNNGK